MKVRRLSLQSVSLQAIFIFAATLALAQGAAAQVAKAPLEPAKGLGTGLTLQLLKSSPDWQGQHGDVTLELRHATLPDALTAIGRQAGVRVMFGEAVISSGHRVSLRVRGVPVERALELVLAETDFVAQYNGGDLALVFRRPGQITDRAPRAAVTGQVTDALSASPLPGVTVAVVGTELGTITDEDGRYALDDVPDGTHELRAERIGYSPESEMIDVGAGATTTLDFALDPEALLLEGIVAVGYGTQERRDLTGAAAPIRMGEAGAGPAVSVDQVMQGQAAGVQVTTSSGAPGGAVSVRIRGTNSISANAEPLYVIDGVPAFVGNSNTPDYRGIALNPLADISPSDIESIEILKDASATAIYGARGANGVVLVTTKRGLQGENTVQIESSYGVQEVPRTLDLLDARNYAELLNEGQTNVGQPELFTPEEVAAFGSGTDWQGEIFRTAPVQSHSITFSGGDERTRYLVSGSLFDQEGIVVNSGFRRYSGRINLDREVSERFRIGQSLTLGRTNGDQIISDNGSGLGSGVVSAALEMDPTLPVRSSDGSYVRNSNFLATPNPVASAMEIVNRRTTTRVLGNIFGEYDFTDALQLRASLGTNALFERQDFYTPSFVAQGQGSGGRGVVSSQQAAELVNDNIVAYSRALGVGHDLDLTAGFTVQAFRAEWLDSAARDFATDLTGPSNLGAGAEAENPTSGVNEWTLLSWLARANYSFRDRYLFTFTGRYDGSSKFGEHNRWGFFPSGAVAWRLSDEAFLRDRLGGVSELKLRASYGYTGNQEIGTYQALAQLANATTTWGNQRIVGQAPTTQAPNPALKWESTRQANVGLDLGFFTNRLAITADVYRSTTDDLLMVVPMPGTSGYATQLRNVGSVRNQGIELGVNAFIMDRSPFTWRANLSLARNSTDVVDLGGADRIAVGAGPVGGLIQTSEFSLLQVDQPLGAYYVYPTNGIWQEGDACPFSDAAVCTPGEYRYEDTNGDGLSTPDDRIMYGNPQPDLFGGLTNNFTYAAFSLDVFLVGSYGNDVVNMNSVRLAGMASGTNMYAWAYDRWTADNPSQTVPRANNNRPRRLLDIHVEDGSFLRLQNLTLGYRIPDGLLPRAKNARVYVSGQNLWLWTDYTGYDPELSSYGGHPVFRGVDMGAYPHARTISFGLNATF